MSGGTGAGTAPAAGVAEIVAGDRPIREINQ